MRHRSLRLPLEPMLDRTRSDMAGNPAANRAERAF
jgi:hypothetical protein